MPKITLCWKQASFPLLLIEGGSCPPHRNMELQIHGTAKIGKDLKDHFVRGLTQLYHVPKHHIRTFIEHFQVFNKKCFNFPVLDNPLCEEIIPNT